MTMYGGFNMTNNILVTGATGNIGLFTMRKLIEEGGKVVAAVTGKEDN